MAPSAAEPSMKLRDKLAQWLEPRPGRLELALRLGVICALTGLVAEIYQTPNAALTMYVVFFLNQKDRAASLVSNVVLLLVMTFIIGFVFFVARFVINNPMWRVASIATISIAFLFLTSASKLKPVGVIIALIVGYALDVLGSIPLGEYGTRELLYAWLFVGIPVGVSLIVNLLFAPPPRRLVEQTIAWRLWLAAAMLRGPDPRKRARFTEALREGTAPIDEWLRLAGVEKSASPEIIGAFRQAALSTLCLSSDIDLLDRDPTASFPTPLRQSIAQGLDDMAGTLAAGGQPANIVWQEPDAESKLSPLAAKLLVHIKESLTHFADVTPRPAPAQKRSEEKGGFLAKDAFTNPDHIQYALKTTAAAMFCYVLYSLLDWPGIHTCFITCFIVSLGTAAESVEKLGLRIVGCLIGAAAGYGALLFLLPDLTSIGALMIVIFVGAFGAAYVAVGCPRISYAGFQIAFAFFLCVVQGPAPAFDLKIARDRVIGILLGNLVSYFVHTQIWPVSVTRRIDPAIAALLRRLSAMAGSVDSAARRALASGAQAALGAVEADLHLARYEPRQLHPSSRFLLSRDDAAVELAGLEAPLLLEADMTAATRLAHLADALETSQTSRPWAHIGPRSGSLSAALDDHLLRLEQSLAQGGKLTVAHYAPA